MKNPPYDHCEQCKIKFPVPMMSPYCPKCLKLRKHLRAEHRDHYVSFEEAAYKRKEKEVKP